jgi:hypothetical protein
MRHPRLHPVATPACHSIWIAAVVGTALGVSSPAGAAARVDPRLRAAVAAEPAGRTLPVWVVLADKGTHEAQKAAPPLALVSERSLRRRAKVLPAWQLVDAADLPVEEGYVRALAATGARIRHRSRWLNRVSVEATLLQLDAIAALPCVQAVEPVTRFRRATTPQRAAERDEAVAPSKPTVDRSAPGSRRDRLAGTPDYGPSLGQLQLMRVTDLHARGLTGTGVLVGHFDNGYRLLSHECLDSVVVVATHDFVDGDVDPAPPVGSPSNYGAHGIITLSVLAGWAPGQIVGAAYGASFVLARTENDASETPLEEDNWIAAIEWADSLGIDVASTSLGYLSYDAPYPSWSWVDMNGNTTAITRAADLAVARGIVVVNSAGNEGFNADHNTLIAPADGDSVITAGSVLANGTRSSFSSVGPTTDVPARIKPDLMAQGSGVRVARATGVSDYGSSSGTSLSCPLLAGAVTLLVEAQPAATPMQIRDALRLTASHAATPDNLYGWGIVDVVAALDYLNAADVTATPAARRAGWLTAYPNPFNPQATLLVGLVAPATVQLAIFDVRGRLVRTLLHGALDASVHRVQWDGRDAYGLAQPSGIYLARLQSLATDTPLAEQKLVLTR